MRLVYGLNDIAHIKWMVRRSYSFITFDSFLNNDICCFWFLMAYELEVGHFTLHYFFVMCQQNKEKSDIKAPYYHGTGK